MIDALASPIGDKTRLLKVSNPRVREGCIPGKFGIGKRKRDSDTAAQVVIYLDWSRVTG